MLLSSRQARSEPYLQERTAGILSLSPLHDIGSRIYRSSSTTSSLGYLGERSHQRVRRQREHPLSRVAGIRLTTHMPQTMTRSIPRVSTLSSILRIFIPSQMLCHRMPAQTLHQILRHPQRDHCSKMIQSRHIILRFTTGSITPAYET